MMPLKQKTIKTCCEIPLSLASENESLNDFDFLLFHLYKENPSYKEWVSHLHHSNSDGSYRISICDCSAYEYYVRGEKLPVDEYIKFINTIQPTFYVLPDVLMSKDETMQGVESFPMDEVLCLRSWGTPGIKPIGVIQGNSEKDLLWMLSYYRDKGIGNIAIPFHNSFFKDDMYGDAPTCIRAEYINGLSSYLGRPVEANTDMMYSIGRCWFIEKHKGDLAQFQYVHLLGSHCVWEKKFLRDSSNVVNSIDTGYPVKCAISGCALFEEHNKPEIIIDEFLERDDLDVELIIKNVEKFKNL